MVAAALAAFVVPAFGSLVIVIVAAVTAWQLGRATSAKRNVSVAVTVRRVRFQHRMSSRGYLEVDDNGTRTWWPVYFHTDLLAVAPGAAALRSKCGAFLIEPGIGARPSGRRTTQIPTGTPLDAPRLSENDLRTRSARFGSLRRRIVLDSSAAAAGPVIGLLWILVDGGGVAAFFAVTVVASVASVWWAAIRGSDPS